MSAFVVDKSHIDALVTTALRGPIIGEGNGITPESVWTGCILRWFAAPVTIDIPFEEACRLSREGRYDEGDRIGQFLVDENVRSVRYRYEDDGENLPGPCDPYWIEPYEYITLHAQRVSNVQALKALDCYEYQSCEHPGWRTSEAFQFIDALRRKLICTLPGYEDAAWEIKAPPRRLTVLNGNGDQARREGVPLK